MLKLTPIFIDGYVYKLILSVAIASAKRQPSGWALG
ncbi:uncharacterized protein METZ01_LOCUS120902 [marine metagenome]|uniref:Uncharacterized protein n=1 Tax=marine metagenome TaxID=408172 RepID=A0A381XTI5_9ZZZZ